MLPYSQHPPPHFSVCLIDLTVAFSVAEYFFSPKHSVTFGNGSVIPTAVPKTRIDKDDDLLFREIKIRFAGQRSGM